MDVEAGMSPRHDELDNLLRDLPFPQKNAEHLVLKDLFQGLRIQCPSHLGRSVSIESAIGAEYVTMGVEVQKIYKGLDRYDCPGSCLLLWDGDPKKSLQRSLCTVTKLQEEPAVIQEVAPDDLGYAEDGVTTGNGLEDLLTEPLAEFHDAILVTGRTEVAAFA